MKQNLSRLVLGGVAIACLSGLFIYSAQTIPIKAASADQLEDAQQELQQRQANIENTRRELREKVQQENSVLGKLSTVNREMNNTQMAINDLNSQTRNVETAIQQAQKEIAEAQKRQGTQLDLLKARMKDIYINGNVSYLEVVLQANSITDFLTRMDLMEKVVQRDAQLIHEIEAEQKTIEARKADLELRRQELAQIKARMEEQRSRLAAQNEEQKVVLAQVREQKDSIAEMLDAEEAASQRLEARIRSLQSKTNRPSMTQGTWGYPLENYAPVTSSYGPRYHPVRKKNSYHTGVDLGAPAGASILATNSGVVIVAGYDYAYGNCVVIDHGGGITTLYGHMSSLGVSEGQTVQKGDFIGKVGSTGLSTGPHLHYEVRINGSHTNPMGYIGG
ncbi:peptidoglycan DD-metalloendopeptidase family protein [Heliobacillus mobilis]|uniref:Peptidoglycan DD-metalloendopeptidase family protein n=1 Tax=Heliobacterium mobile TaxID=28064 RepID=A0A6I3SL33_HELMO|nr:peptidoglycan DD-metalloendopeptidase family protein [Heliobacterium mobile]MTV49629.1 peptidoglycan DD-metalloendopeptidase family protein [Heliobacterium mobile]